MSDKETIVIKHTANTKWNGDRSVAPLSIEVDSSNIAFKTHGFDSHLSKVWAKSFFEEMVARTQADE